MKVYLNKEYKCVKVEDNTFVANDSSNYIRYYFVTNANGDVIDKMDDTSVIYRNTEPSYVTVAFRRADGDVIQHLMASPKTDTTGKSFFEYEITNTDGVLYKKGALEISAQFIEATLSEAGGVKKVISQKVKAIAINTAHVLDNIGEEAEEYYSQYEQANNDAHAVLQTQITTNFNNIGTLQELTTDAKDDLVKAINEVDAHADANKSEIGDLSTLTTDEKTTIVGAINEVDQHADANKAEIGTLNALTTDEKATLVGAINEVDNHADNATTLANNAVATANSAVATANEAKTTAETAENNANSAVDTANAANATADEAKAIAQGSQRAIGFATLQAAITALNGYSNSQLKVGDNVYIVETGVPDLWVAAVEPNSVAYNYTTNDAFNDDLVENTLVQVGYYKFAYLESDGKPCTVAWQNMTVAASDWVASTEFEDFAYEAKIALSDFVNFSSIPQVVFGLTEATSGNYAPICKAGDKGVYIYSKVNTAITLPTIVTFAPNVHGASMQGGGYTNKGKWVASTTYAIDDLVYTDNGQFVCIEGITSTTSPEQDTQHWQATFVATGKTKNGLKFSGQNTDGSAVQKTFDGSTAVEVAFDETTMTTKEVNGVLKIGAKGTVPEALPQEASALKSGNLPTSGWNTTNPNLITSNIELHIKQEETQLSSLNKKIDSSYFNYTGNWQVKKYGTKTSTSTASYISTINGKKYRTIEFPNPDLTSEKYTLFIDESGNLYRGGGSSYFTTPELYALNAMYAYTISDTSITANSDILMELTDDGGVKAYSMEAGKITVIRDTVPTQAIPYTYKVKHTNASGQFTLVNHFVPSIPESPTSLPVTYKKVSGSLPTTGWTPTIQNFSNARVLKQTTYDKEVTIYSSGYAKYIRLTGWEVEIAGEWHKFTKVTDTRYAYNDYSIEYIGSDAIIRYTPSSVQAWYKIYTDGHVSAKLLYNGDTIMPAFRNTEISDQTFAITDTFITANTSVKMYLTDAGGVKAQSKASGSITVIRDSVPTTAIPYEYEVEQTSAEGLFEVINAYVPDVPTVPTKTSQLENDSGFITSADIPSAGEWVTVTGETATLTEAGTYQVIASVNDMQSIVYWDGSTAAYGTKSTAPSVSTSGGTAYLFINCAYPLIDASGTLSVHLLTAGNSSGAWTETNTTASGFKYRKIN